MVIRQSVKGDGSWERKGKEGQVQIRLLERDAPSKKRLLERDALPSSLVTSIDLKGMPYQVHL
jgi:hypothetical protein